MAPGRKKTNYKVKPNWKHNHSNLHGFTGNILYIYIGSITDSVDMNLSKLQEIVEDRGAWHVIDNEVANSQT